MADFVEEFSRRVSDVASDITKKTGDTLEIQKIKSNVRTLKRANERDLADIGRMVYEKFQSGEVSDMDYVTLCEEIEKREEEIEKQEEEIVKIQGGAVGTLFALDMAVKQYIEENVSEKEEKNFCGTKVLIRKVYNKGFAFNSMDSEPAKVKKASVITTAVILMLTLAESFREGHKVNKTALTLLSAGAISNTYDRIVRGKVVDYIGIRSDHKMLGDVTANLADVYILIGSVLMWMRRIGKR